MQLQIDRVSDVKQGQYGPQSTIHSGNERYYVNSDASEYAGKLVDAEVIEKQGRNGKTFKIAKILKVVAESHQYANGATQPWSDWETWLREVNHLLLELFPDELELHFDRAPVRGALFQSLILRKSEGKIAADDEAPF